MNSTAIGRIQCQTEPVPEVGSQPRPIAKRVMPTMAIQKSGAEAPISEVNVTIRSKMPPGRKAAIEPMTMAATVTRVMVMTASHNVQTKACSTTAMAGRAWRRLSPKLRCRTSQT